jgi:solute carrier family 13 (sodium-dependent dicarboxylate transporter), member 2/3/5
MNKNTIGLVLGPLLFAIMLFIEPEGLSGPGKYTLAATLWMAVWWVTECVPIAVTAFLPLILFPLLGIMSIQDTGAAFGDPVIFLFIACFMMATAIERWKLHRRIALNIIRYVGYKPSSIVLGFMLATGILSMWLSNTATTIMMLPIALSLVAELDMSSSTDDKFTNNFSTALLLGIAYASSIGGVGTLIGTPTNILFTGAVAKYLQSEISFVSWMLFAIPPVTVILFISWKYMVRSYKLSSHNEVDTNATKDKIDQYIRELGKIKYEEIVVASIFALAALGWLLRAFWLKHIIPNDAIIALAAMMLMFIIPAEKKIYTDDRIKDDSLDEDTLKNYKRILDWSTAVNIPWGVILLFGGGLSLAAAFERTGLATWLGAGFGKLEFLPLFVILLLVITAVNFLTEITSNVATVSMVLPVLISMSGIMQVHPYYLMIGATCAASCAFMLPVATAPNAIVFGTDKIKLGDMIRTGFWLNIISIMVFTVFIYFLMPLVWGIK